MPQLTINDGSVSLEVAVTGTGPLLVVAPSLGRGGEDFAAFAAEVASQGFTVARPQPRGAGASTGPLEHLSYRDWAADLGTVIRRLTEQPAIVLGHAAGSRYARTLATQQPQLVRGVVVAAAACRVPRAELRVALELGSDPNQPRDARVEALATAFFARPEAAPEWLSGWHPATLRAQRSTVESAGWEAAGSAPVLDLQGELDPWRPSETRGELSAALGSRVAVTVVSGAAHAMFPERPVEAAAAILAWAATI